MNIDIDTEQLIEEIADRPAIWDYNSPEYQSRKERINAWDEICNVLFEDFDSNTIERKCELYRLLQRKWKSLRDCYVRERNQSKQLGRRRYRRRYVFAKALSFLETTTAKGKSGPRANEEADPLNDDTIQIEETTNEQQVNIKPELYIETMENSQSGSGSGIGIGSSRRIKLDEHYENNKRDLSLSLSPRTTTPVKSPLEDDEDRLFLLSLVKDLKKVPDYNKLEAKSELLLVLSKWKRSGMEMTDIGQM